MQPGSVFEPGCRVSSRRPACRETRDPGSKSEPGSTSFRDHFLVRGANQDRHRFETGVSRLAAELAQQRRLVEVVDEGPLAVDLDHGEPLPIARFQRRVVGDIDRVVVDGQPVELRTRALAERAAAAGVQDDAGQG
jgi:hypothetical protein